LTISNIGPLESEIDAIYFDTTGTPITGIVIGASAGTVTFTRALCTERWIWRRVPARGAAAGERSVSLPADEAGSGAAGD
ncbi:MAG: hypothetical protein ACRD9L_14540, partial [Bryobacteraceae bacterium]